MLAVKELLGNRQDSDEFRRGFQLLLHSYPTGVRQFGSHDRSEGVRTSLGRAVRVVVLILLGVAVLAAVAVAAVALVELLEGRGVVAFLPNHDKEQRR